MGMDFEIMLSAIEEEFKIKISDEEAENLWYKDLEGVFEFILKEAYSIRLFTKYCQSSRVFYKMRKALMKFSDMPRNSISPKMNLKTLFPAQTRIETINKLSKEIELELPRLRVCETEKIRLENSAWMLFFLSFFSFGLVIVNPYLPFICVGNTFVYNYIIEKKIREKTNLFPNNLYSFRDLIMETIDLNRFKLGMEESADREIQIWNNNEYKIVNEEYINKIRDRFLNLMVETFGYELEDLSKDLTVKEICY